MATINNPPHRLKVWILIAVTIGAVAALPFIPRISQDLAYHEFANTRQILGIPNFWNVITNLPFLLVGLFGLASLRWRKRTAATSSPHFCYVVFSVGTMLVSFGSAYYHYRPSNASLVWDRLPMTVAFMALLAMVIGDSISLALARKLLWPLLLLGVGSVGYWYATELAGAGDLRPYGLVQFLPMILLPLILLMFGTKNLRAGFLWAAFAAYGLAKVAEHFDGGIYAATGLISGHSVKHLLAALSTFWIVLAFRQKAEFSKLAEES